MLEESLETRHEVCGTDYSFARDPRCPTWGIVASSVMSVELAFGEQHFVPTVDITLHPVLTAPFAGLNVLE